MESSRIHVSRTVFQDVEEMDRERECQNDANHNKAEGTSPGNGLVPGHVDRVDPGTCLLACLLAVIIINNNRVE